MRTSIFEKQPVSRPGQLAAVAERRFADAQALCDTGENARANGVQYLAGIVLDVLLKAQLMRRYPSVARARGSELAESERAMWGLIWRSHDLAGMLDNLPELRVAVQKRGVRDGLPYWAWLTEICGVWSVHARYSSMTSTIDEARMFLERVRHLKELLK